VGEDKKKENRKINSRDKKKRAEHNEQVAKGAVSIPGKPTPETDVTKNPSQAKFVLRDISLEAKSPREQARDILLGAGYPEIIDRGVAETALEIFQKSYREYGNHMALFDRWMLLWWLSQFEDGIYYAAILEEERHSHNDLAPYEDYKILFQEAKEQRLPFINFKALS